MATRNGYTLAGIVTIGGWFSINTHDTCSLICRDATTLHRLSEDACNGHPAQSSPNIPIDRLNKLQDQWDARIEKATEAAERRIRERAATLAGVESVDFQGDPRGAPVALVMTDEWFANGGTRADLAAWGNPKAIVVPYGRWSR